MTYDEYIDVLNKLEDVICNYPEVYSATISSTLGGFRTGFLTKITEKNNLSQDDLDILDNYNILDNSYKLDLNPLDAAIYISNELREKSHGACQVDKIFVSENLYNSIAKNIGPEVNKNFKIRNAPLLKCELLPENNMVVFCKSKFKTASSSDLVAFIELEKNAN